MPLIGKKLSTNHTIQQALEVHKFDEVFSCLYIYFYIHTKSLIFIPRANKNKSLQLHPLLPQSESISATKNRTRFCAWLYSNTYLLQTHAAIRLVHYNNFHHIVHVHSITVGGSCSNALLLILVPDPNAYTISLTILKADLLLIPTTLSSFHICFNFPP